MGGGEQKYCLEILNNGFGMILVGGVRGSLGYAGFYRRGKIFFVRTERHLHRFSVGANNIRPHRTDL